MFAQTELARAVLRMLMAGHAVPTHHAIQLRNWAVCSEDSDRKSTRLNSSHLVISYAVFCLKKKNLTCAQALPFGEICRTPGPKQAPGGGAMTESCLWNHSRSAR